MRVISGSFKGLKLKGSTKLNIRPTKDKVKEALFDIIGISIENSIFLDLFSGYGNVGIEAISRKANHVTFVDNNSVCVSILKHNLSLLRQNIDNIDIFCENALAFLKERKVKEDKFDIIVIDPPYSSNLAEKCLSVIGRYDILNNAGLVIAEIPSKKDISSSFYRLKKFREQVYGSTKVVFYK